MSDELTKPVDGGYATAIIDSKTDTYTRRILIGTASTGSVRIEWCQARYGQIIPVNWSSVQAIQYMNSFMPLRYQVADAQNLIVREFIDKHYEWLLLWEHDVLPPPNATLMLNEYMMKNDVPVMSGLYYTRSHPSYPLTFRGVGNTAYTDWKLGDQVWCDGVPTGFLLIHHSILDVMWAESPEYMINYGNSVQVTRRVFDTPQGMWYDPQSEAFNTIVGTSDLDWCKRVMKNRVFERAGWPKYQEMEFPFLCDTRIFCKHVNPNGEQFPVA